MSTTRRLNRPYHSAGSAETLHCLRWWGALFALILISFLITPIAKAQSLVISTSAGGVTITGGLNAYDGSFGNVNALGIGSYSTAAPPIPVNNGAIYYTPVDFTPSGMKGKNPTATIAAYVSGSFTSTAGLTVQSCPANSGCNSSTQFAPLSTSAGAPTTLVTGLADNVTGTAYLAIFVPDNDGANAFTGTDSVTITVLLQPDKGPKASATLRLTAMTQTAVQLTLSTAPGGATIANALDFSLDFGNVNALGIGPAAGLTPYAVAGGAVYSTPYLVTPAFAEFASTTATIQVYVSTDFAHPASLELRDASASAGPFTSISKTFGTQTLISSTAADRTSITRYLGLFVSNANGPGSFTGTDNATLTFTLTVP